MSEITIEKNIPVPEKRKGYMATLSAMEIGESFEESAANRYTISSLVSHGFHSCTEKRFLISNKGQEKGKIRVWRLPDVITQESTNQ